MNSTPQPSIDPLQEALAKCAQLTAFLQSLTASSQASTTTPYVRADGTCVSTPIGATFICDHQHRAILGSLDGIALKKYDLATATGIPAGSLWRKLQPLKERGLVLNHPGVGYYRPDSPPPGSYLGERRCA